MLRWLRSGLLLRILGALLIVSVLPIYLIRQFSRQLYEDTRMDVVNQSQSALDEKAIQGLQSRAVALANAVSNFLAEREGDVRFLSAQTPDVRTYLNFSSRRTGTLW